MNKSRWRIFGLVFLLILPPMATLKSPTCGRVKIPQRQNDKSNLNSENLQFFSLFHPLSQIFVLGESLGSFLQTIAFPFELQQMAMMKQAVKYG